VTRRTTAATLRRYRAEWQAALARRDFAMTRTILDAALSAVAREATQDLDSETRALHELLALDRRLESIGEGAAPARLPPAKHAFAEPSTRRFRDTWHRAIEEADYVRASRVLRGAMAALSRQLVRRTRSQQALISRLKGLQRTPLEFSPVPTRCALCGGTSHPGVDSGRLFVCTDCIQKASEILAEQTRGEGARGAT
jgi:hypothetical protein